MKERGATVLVVDGGGRGTALVHKYSQSPHVERIIAVPGNDWMPRTIYGAGIKIENNRHYVNGGRLFCVVGEGKNVNKARGKAYEAMDKVRIEGGNLHYRKDIGWRDVERLRK